MDPCTEYNAIHSLLKAATGEEVSKIAVDNARRLGEWIQHALSHTIGAPAMNRTIFRVVTKMVESIGSQANAAMSNGQYEHVAKDVLGIPTMMQFCRVFSASNQKATQHIIQVLFEQINPKQYNMQLQITLRLIINLLTDFQIKVDTCMSMGMSMGMGMGMSVEGTTQSALVQERLAQVEDAAQSLQHLITGGGQTITQLIINTRGFLQSWIDCYDAITNVQKHQLCPLNLCEKAKYHILSLVYTLIHTHFLEPLRSQSAGETFPVETVAVTRDELCDYMLPLLDTLSHEALQPDTSTTQQSSTFIWSNHPFFLFRAPMLLDLEIEFQLARKLDQIEDGDARVQYLRMSLENTVSSTGLSYIQSERERWRNHVTDQLNARSNPQSDQHTQPLPAYTTTTEDDIMTTSLISQVIDLFPDLGEGFVQACLNEYGSPEEVIAHILEDNFSPHLKNLNRKLPRMVVKKEDAKGLHSQKIDLLSETVNSLSITQQPKSPEPQPQLQVPLSTDAKEEPQPSILSTRHNIFANDEFDLFHSKVDRSKVHIGKSSLSQVSMDQDKAPIRVYDSYDDEYDDTFDSLDIRFAGTAEVQLEDELEGTIHTNAKNEKVGESKSDTNDPLDEFKHELVSVWMQDKTVFDRSQRGSKQREQLKKRVGGVSDEVLEGWAKMFERNPRRDKMIQDMQMERPNQPSLPTTRYTTRGNTSTGDSEDEPSDEEHGGGPSQRGRGRGRGGTNSRERSRQHRDRKRGRREAHFKKMAKGAVGWS